MHTLTYEQQIKILEAGRAIAFNRIWVASDPSLDLFEGSMDLHLIVNVGPGRTVSANTMPWFQEAVEHIVPDAVVAVSRVQDLNGMEDAADLRVLLHMTELTDHITNQCGGNWRVCCASGSVYILDLTPGQRSLVRLPGRTQPEKAYAGIPVAELRRDEEALPLLAIVQLELGKPGSLIIDIRGDGIPTWRETTPIVSIERLPEA